MANQQRIALRTVIEGSLRTEAPEILVYDFHWDGRNIVLEEVDERVRVIRGTERLTEPSRQPVNTLQRFPNSPAGCRDFVDR